MGCCSAKAKKITPDIKPPPPPPREDIRSFDVGLMYDSKNPKNQIYQQMADSFKRSLSPQKRREKLPGPRSYAVPYDPKPSFFKNPPADEWEGYHSHKFLSVNIAQYYIEECQHLPLPPSECDQVLQEAFMTLNILRDDPEYIINNLLEPIRDRFFEEIDNGKVRWRMNTFSQGTISMKQGLDDLMEEAVEALQELYEMKLQPLKWDLFLESCSKDHQSDIKDLIIDKYSRKRNELVIQRTLDEFGGISEDEELKELLVPKWKYGFEMVIMMLLDDENPKNRVNRSAILDPKLSEISIIQAKHTQFGIVNYFVCKVNKRVEDAQSTFDQTLIDQTVNHNETILYKTPLNKDGTKPKLIGNIKTPMIIQQIKNFSISIEVSVKELPSTRSNEGSHNVKLTKALENRPGNQRYH